MPSSFSSSLLLLCLAGGAYAISVPPKPSLHSMRPSVSNFHTRPRDSGLVQLRGGCLPINHILKDGLFNHQKASEPPPAFINARVWQVSGVTWLFKSWFQSLHKTKTECHDMSIYGRSFLSSEIASLLGLNVMPESVHNHKMSVFGTHESINTVLSWVSMSVLLNGLILQNAVGTADENTNSRCLQMHSAFWAASAACMVFGTYKGEISLVIPIPFVEITNFLWWMALLNISWWQWMGMEMLAILKNALPPSSGMRFCLSFAQGVVLRFFDARFR